ncbi:MAG: ATP-dependent helicase [Ruminococcus sp.]|nr:ATP-dependent helicase [Ruminococcus sp.]
MDKEQFKNEYLIKLNEQQRKAVETVDGAVLLLAVPGSGKTTVLVTRIGYMIYSCGVLPENILTMTYTVAANQDMKNRFVSIFGYDYSDRLIFRTINALSNDIITYYSRNISKKESFKLISDKEQAAVIAEIYKKYNNEPATENIIKEIKSLITYAKNMMLDTEVIEKYDETVPNFKKIFTKYNDKLKSLCKMDYDDQMKYALIILQQYESVLNYYQEKYKYICVDESQDTSKIQHTIINMIASKYSNIFMVGDEDQSIYGFRGAYPQALMDFEKTYPSAKILLMENNYRSTRNIVDIANRFVEKNKFRREKRINPIREKGNKVFDIRIIIRSDQYKYLYAMAKSCERETAVLYRNHDSALPLIDLFERNGIKYYCKKFDNTFFSHKIINDIRDIINFAYSPHSTDIFMRIYYKFECYISKQAAVNACKECKRSGTPIIENLIKNKDLSEQVKEKCISLYNMFDTIVKQNAETAVRLIGFYGYKKYIEKMNYDKNKLTILEMLGKNEVSPKGLLERLDELQQIITTDNLSNNNQEDSLLVLSTIHSSKGLEYDRVFLLDTFDGVLPSNPDYSLEDLAEIYLYQEERRLFYVGITRAKNELYMFNSENDASSFVDEALKLIDDEILNNNDAVAFIRKNMCGKVFTHPEKGLATIIGFCGENMLVEFQNKSLDFVRIGDLLEY